jgi:hypothetical protein
VPTKDQLHALIDLLPDAEVPAAGDPLTEDDWQAVRAGQAEIAGGEFTTLEDLKHELNL